MLPSGLAEDASFSNKVFNASFSSWASSSEKDVYKRQVNILVHLVICPGAGQCPSIGCKPFRKLVADGPEAPFYLAFVPGFIWLCPFICHDPDGLVKAFYLIVKISPDALLPVYAGQLLFGIILPVVYQDVLRHAVGDVYKRQSSYLIAQHSHLD